MRTAVVAILVLTAVPALVSGCLGATSNDGEGGEAATPVATDGAFEPASYSFDGEFLLGGLDAPDEYAFEVPEGTTEVMGLLTWTIPGGALDFQLVDPTGEVVADGWGESDQHRFVTTTTPPVPGAWAAIVSAQQGADIHYQLNVEAREAEPFGPVDRTYTVAPQDFAEVNLNMVPGDGFSFAWESTGDVYFNVHFHDDGDTARPIEHTGTELDGNFTAPNTEVYSLLWRNEGVLPVDVTVSVDGTYRLHSMTRAPPANAR